MGLFQFFRILNLFQFTRIWKKIITLTPGVQTSVHLWTLSKRPFSSPLSLLWGLKAKKHFNTKCNEFFFNSHQGHYNFAKKIVNKVIHFKFSFCDSAQLPCLTFVSWKKSFLIQQLLLLKKCVLHQRVIMFNATLSSFWKTISHRLHKMDQRPWQKRS